MTDKEYMRIAYELAAKGRGRTSPNPMVGALIVKKGRVVGRGWHRRCGGPHAEVLALRQAGAKARGGRMYVTLEPCGHFGRTPPCVDAMIASGITQVIIGMKDPNPLTNGRSIAKLKRAGIKTTCGVLQRELEQLNEAFIKYIRHHLPFVVTKTAQTLDGKIATSAGESRWITSAQARAFARRRRSDFDAILAGTNTVLKDDPLLSAARSSKRLKKIVLDPGLKISPRARLFRAAKPDCLLAVTAKANTVSIKKFRSLGIEVVVCPASGGLIDLKWLMKELARRGITSVLIEGGARVIGSALAAGIVDKMEIYLAPRILGDPQAVDSINKGNFFRLEDMVRLRDLNVRRLGPDFFIEGYIDA